MTGTILKTLIAAVTLAVFMAVPVAAPAEAQTATKSASKSKPLKGKSYYGRRGGYSYKSSDVVGSTTKMDPSMNRRSSGGPLGGDFFYETPWSPFGGNTHYMN